jgi:hypothetical protein
MLGISAVEGRWGTSRPASAVVVWELSGTDTRRQHRVLRLIALAFALVAVYLTAQSSIVLATGYHPRAQPGRDHLDHSHRAGDVRPGHRQGPHRHRAGQPGAAHRGPRHPGGRHPATAVLAELVLNATLGWRWADPVAGYVLVLYAVREVRAILTDHDALPTTQTEQR